MSLFKGSFWKKLPGILKKILGILTVIEPSAAAAAERAQVVNALAPPAVNISTGPPVVLTPVHTLSADDVRMSLTKFGAALLWLFGALKSASLFIHVITIAPGAETHLNDFLAALPRAFDAVMAAKDALFALVAGITFHGLRNAAPGGVVPKALK